MSPNIFEDNLDDSDSAWSRREAARLKQIQIGKARPEYQRYVREVPPSQRQASHPCTPDPRARVSKRQFDRALGDWRRRLHEFDSVPRRVHDYDSGLWSSAPPSHKKGGSGNRAALNDGRGSAAGVNGQRSSAPRRARAREAKVERSAAKLVGRKLAESQEDSRYIGKQELQSLQQQQQQPQQQEQPQQQQQQQQLQQQQQQHQQLPQQQQQQLTQPQEAIALSQAGVVRISLADQLLEMPQLAQAPGMDGSWPWYGDASAYAEHHGATYSQDAAAYAQETSAYGQEAIDMTWSPEALQKAMVTPSPNNRIWNERADGDTPPKDAYASMPEESMMIPHKLFEDSPEKSCGSPFQTEGCLYEAPVSAQPSLQPGLDMLTDLGAGGQPHLQLQPLPPPQMLSGISHPLSCSAPSQSLTCPAAQAQPSSPRTPKLTPQEVKSTLQMSPCAGTPLPTTPRRGHWVPETPSPDRMYSMMQHMMPFVHPPTAEFNPYFSMTQ